MTKIRKFTTSIVPAYGFLSLIVAVAYDFLIYCGSRRIAGGWRHYNIECGLDDWIPFWPPSIIIYFGCYLFWIVNYILIARQGKKEVSQFFAAELLSKTVCLAFYLLFPTTNNRPVVEPNGIWNQLMIFLYETDAADNLFPSIHCLVSWFCYIGIKNKPQIPVWYQRFSCIVAILVFISTVTTKQHVIVDVFGGVLVAEVCFWIGKKKKVYETYEIFLDRADKLFFTRGRGVKCSQKRK